MQSNAPKKIGLTHLSRVFIDRFRVVSLKVRARKGFLCVLVPTTDVELRQVSKYFLPCCFASFFQDGRILDDFFECRYGSRHGCRFCLCLIIKPRQQNRKVWDLFSCKPSVTTQHLRVDYGAAGGQPAFAFDRLELC